MESSAIQSRRTSPKPPSNKNPVLLPDKTGNNRHIASEPSNNSIFPTSPPTDPTFKLFPTKPLIPLLIKQEITGK
jgi:hypothetical protein